MKPGKRPLIMIVILALLLVGYWVWRHYFQEDTQNIEASGTIEATTVELMAKAPGTLQKLVFQAGDTVTKGQLAAEISRADLLAQEERDTINVTIAQNKLDDLVAGARSQQLTEAQANVNIKKAAYDKSLKDLDRAQELYGQNTISQAELEGYQNSKTIAYNQLVAAKATYSLLVSGSTSNQIKAAQNQVKVMEATLKATRATIADLKITSPLDGIIQSSNYEAGEYVTAGASLATIVNLDQVWITIYLPTEDLPFIQIGEKARFTVSGLDKQFEGTISEIATQGEFTPKTIQTKNERANIVYKVKIKADNPDSILKPGMPADVVISKADESP